jgi:hypothetical protein
MAHQPRLDRQRADLHALPVDPVPDVENIAEIVDLSTFWRGRRPQACPRLLRSVHQAALRRGRRVVAPPNEEAGKVEAMIGMQVRQQYVHRVRIRMALQRTEYTTAEVNGQRRGFGRRQQIPGRWRIRPDNTAGATEYGDSHAH